MMVAPDDRNEAMFAIMYRQVHIIHEVNIIGAAYIICQRQTSLEKATFVRQTKVRFFLWAIRDSNPGPTVMSRLL